MKEINELGKAFELAGKNWRIILKIIIYLPVLPFAFMFWIVNEITNAEINA